MPAICNRRRYWLALLLLAVTAAGGWLLAQRYAFDTGDWLLRCRELRVLRTGIDPFDVFTRRATVPGHVSLLDAAPGDQAVHNYAPWTYGFCFPMAFTSGETVPRLLAIAGNSLCLILLTGTLLIWFRRRTGQWDLAALLTAAALLLDLFPLFRTLTVGNFSLAAATAAFAMALLLNRGRDVAAGFMLAILMLKIQIGVVFLIPLIAGRKYRTLATGGLLCLAAACLPAWFVGKSPLQLTWQLLYSGDPSFLSPYTGGLFSLLARHLPPLWLTAANAAVSLGVLGWVSWQLRHHRDWLLKCVPAAAVVPLWNYSQTIDQCLLLIPLAWYLLRLTQAATPAGRCRAIAAVGVFSTGLFHGLWNLCILSGRFCRPDGLGPLFIGGLTLCYAAWLILCLRLPQTSPDHS